MTSLQDLEARVAALENKLSQRPASGGGRNNDATPKVDIAGLDIDMDDYDGPTANYASSDYHITGFTIACPVDVLDDPFEQVVDDDGVTWHIVPLETRAGKRQLVAIDINGEISEPMESDFDDRPGGPVEIVFCQNWARTTGGKAQPRLGGNSTKPKPAARKRPARQQEPEEPF